MPESIKSPVLGVAAVDFDAVSAEVLDAIRPVIEHEVREASDLLYGATMEAVQDYLCDNVRFNIRSRLDAAEAERRAEWERAENLTKQRDELFWALKGLVQVARTSGGTAGADQALMAACERGERAIEYAFGDALRQASRRGGEA